MDFIDVTSDGVKQNFGWFKKMFFKDLAIDAMWTLFVQFCKNLIFPFQVLMFATPEKEILHTKVSNIFAPLDLFF